MMYEDTDAIKITEKTVIKNKDLARHKQECYDFEKIMQEHVDKCKFPSYEEIEKIILQKIKTNDDKHHYMMLFSEYSETSHEWMKKCFKNFNDKDRLKSIGNKLNNKGGFKGMQGAFYGLIECIILIQIKVRAMPEIKFTATTTVEELLANDIEYIRFVPNYISVAWDDIGEWKY